MAHVSIIGNGNMGQAISGIVTASGNTVEVLGHGDTKPVTGDIVILAVPYPAVSDVIAKRADQLAGKVVVDITNPLNFETFDALVVPADSSAAAQIAAALPQSRVVKAFNTVGAEVMVDPRYPDGPAVLPVAGDDTAAKATALALARDLGFAPIDAGPLSMARYLEPFAMLWIKLALVQGLGRRFAFRLLQR